MQITLTQPLAFSHIGQRLINQDTIHPAIGEGNARTSLFIVCDGMGGADKGEVASRLLCDSIANYAVSLDYPVLDVVHLQTALTRAYAAYDTFLAEHPLVNRMGSTLALAQMHRHGVTVAHIGDSRVYQFRAGRVVFQTEDHRQVNDMVADGIITMEQAKTHPWRNRLSRAVVAQSTGAQPLSSRSIPDCVLLTDVRAGDYFFMCTDGVMEQFDTPMLATLFVGNEPDVAKVDRLLAQCAGQTKDNYSGYIIGIQHVAKDVTQSTRPLTAAGNYAV